MKMRRRAHISLRRPRTSNVRPSTTMTTTILPVSPLSTHCCRGAHQWSVLMHISTHGTHRKNLYFPYQHAFIWNTIDFFPLFHLFRRRFASCHQIECIGTSHSAIDKSDARERVTNIDTDGVLNIDKHPRRMSFDFSTQRKHNENNNLCVPSFSSLDSSQFSAIFAICIGLEKCANRIATSLVCIYPFSRIFIDVKRI